MRETRSSGSVEGVMSNRDPYSDSSFLPLRATSPVAIPGPQLPGVSTGPSSSSFFLSVGCRTKSSLQRFQAVHQALYSAWPFRYTVSFRIFSSQSHSEQWTETLNLRSTALSCDRCTSSRSPITTMVLGRARLSSVPPWGHKYWALATEVSYLHPRNHL